MTPAPSLPFRFARLPAERIVRTDFLATAFNADRFNETLKRIVVLACGHSILTRALKRAHCIRCQRMR